MALTQFTPSMAKNGNVLKIHASSVFAQTRRHYVSVLALCFYFLERSQKGYTMTR